MSPMVPQWYPNGTLTAGPDLTDVLAVGQRSLTFNADNMPTTVAHPTGSTVTLTYDGESQRAKKTGPNGTTYYFSNEFEQIGATSTCYIFAGNLRVAMVKDYSSVVYFHKDHLGSSSVTTDANGDALEKTRYMPFGGKRGDGPGIVSTAYKFTDQELDAESGLYNFDARFYDPVVGRFASSDNIVPKYYNPQAYDRFSYCINNPLKYVDPSGHNYGSVGPGGAVDFGGETANGNPSDAPGNAPQDSPGWSEHYGPMDHPTQNYLDRWDPRAGGFYCCSRAASPTAGGSIGGRHAYGWSYSTEPQSYGMQNSSGSNNGHTAEAGPLGVNADPCNEVNGSRGREQEVMDSVVDSVDEAEQGGWAPGASGTSPADEFSADAPRGFRDCHSALEEGVENTGLSSPGVPGGRID